MLEHNGRIKTVFKYIDECGDTTEVARDVEADYLGMSEGDILCDLFRDFMVACGFSHLADKEIVFKER